MAGLLTAARMRVIETRAIESGAVTGLELMERAGRGVVEAVFVEWPDLAAAPHRAAVLCGPGNNGGDGFVVARLLKEWGWDVAVFLLGDPDRLPPDARANCARWRAMGPIRSLAKAEAAGAEMVVDALFGTGLARPVEGLGGYARAIAAGGARVVAVDLPSGLCSDSGRWLCRSGAGAETGIRADLTVSFHAEKLGHRLAEGPADCGRVVVADIGLAPAPDAGTVWLLDAGAGRAALGKDGGHKYDHGHALILTGGAGRTGAARLAARGALRVGAGLVTLGVPPAAQQEVACQVTAVMLRRVADGDALRVVLEDGRINALCLGPGLGVERARELVPVALGAPRPGPRAGASGPEVPGRARDGRSVVLDADALTAYGDDPGTLFAMLHENCVLTPHDGEFAQLFPDIAGRLRQPAVTGPAFSRVDAARAAAARAGCVVLLKGADTVIAGPDGCVAVHSASYERAVPWLATAGAGDVLAGFIAGLMARGFDPMQAAGTAAWLHAECARRFGPGLIAEDLPETLPLVLRDLGA